MAASPRPQHAQPPVPGSVFVNALGGAVTLLQPEVGGSGDALKHNLIKELIATNTITSKDLGLIDGDDTGAGH